MTASPPTPTEPAAVPARRSDHVVDVLIAERAPRLTGSIVWPLLRPAFYALLGYAKVREMADAIAPVAGQAALDHVSNLLDLKVSSLNLDRIPATGRCIVVCNHPTGIADGIAVARPGELNFRIIREVVDEVVTVTDDDTAQALLMLLERAKLVVEPAGAVGVAAILSGQVEATGTTVVILSGGNIDPLMMERVISHGLAASERYLKLRIPLPDRPGQLARTAAIVAEANANVVEVLHTRHGNGLQISQVELELHIETRGPEHAEEVLARLREEGFEPRLAF